MKLQSLTDPRPGLTKRQTEILERLERDTPVKRIATDLGVTPAAVYQTIGRLRSAGHVPGGYTPSGRPSQRADTPAGAKAPRREPESRAEPSALTALRRADESASADLIESAITSDDVPSLAYVLGRADAGQEDDFRTRIIEAALRRLGVLGAEQVDQSGERPERAAAEQDG